MAAIVVFIVVAAALVVRRQESGESRASQTSPRTGASHPSAGLAILGGATTVIFSMVGAEIVTVAAAESAESNKTMSRLAANVVLRILLFYVLSIVLILCIVPWNAIQVRRFDVCDRAGARSASRAPRRS